MRILLIEDNPGDARLIQETLREAEGDFNIETVETLSQGIHFLASQDVDVILLDLGLPDSRELEGLLRLRTEAPRFPVVVMTGLNDESLGRRAVQQGAQDYLVKGQVDSRFLPRALMYAIERKRAELSLRELNAELEQRVEVQTAELRQGNETLEQRIAERTAEVQSANQELEHSRIAALNLLEDSLAVQKQLELANERLKESESRYRQLVEVSPDAIFVNRGNQIALVNQAALDLFGLESAGQVLGKDPLDLFHPSHHDLIRSRIKTLFGGGSVPLIEVKVVRTDGSLRTAEVTAVLLQDEAGPAAQVILHDVTERKEREAELKKLNRTLKALSSINQAMVHATDETEFMQQVCRIVVEDCGHVMTWIGLAQEDEARSVKPAASAGVEEGYLDTLNLSYADVERGHGPTGTAIRSGQVDACPNMLTDPRFKPWRKEALKRGYASSIALPLIMEGKPFGALTIYSREPDPFSKSEMELLGELASDLAYGISMIRTRAAHAEAEAAVRQSEARFRQLADASFEGLVIHENGLLLDINERITGMLGYTSEELIGQRFWKFIDKKYHAIVRERVQASSQDLYEVELIHKDGRRVPVEVMGRPLLWKGKTVRVSALRDVTERRKAEAALRESEARYRSLFDSMSEGFALHEMIFDDDGKPVDYRFLEINDAFEQLTGLERKDVVGNTHNRLLPGDSPRWFEVYNRVVKTGEPAHFDNYSPSLERHYDVHAYRPAPGQFAAIFMDVTEQKRLEQDLLRARAEAEQRANELKTVFNSIADGIVVYDAAGQARQANRVAVDILGFDPTNQKYGEIANALSTRTMDGQLLKLAEAPSVRALGGQTVSGERYLLSTHQKGETIVNTSASPLWAGERITGAVTVLQDVTEQYHAEEVKTWLASFPKLNPNPVTEMDEAGTLQYMNPASQRLFPDLESLGKEHPWLAGLDEIAQVLKSGESETISREVQIGQEYYLQAVSVVPENGRVRAYGFEITERKQALKALERSNKRLTLISETASRLLSSPDPQREVEELCRKVLAHLDCQLFINYLVDEKAGKLHLNACAGITEHYRRRLEWLNFGVAVCGRVAEMGERIIAEDIPVIRDPRTDLVRGMGVQAYACHPLKVEGKVVGTLSFGTRTRSHFSEDDVALMKAVTDHVAIAMGRSRAEQALRQARDELELRVEERTSELRETNEQLALERQRFNNVLDDLPAYLILLTPDHHIPFANRYFEERFGKSEGRRCYEYLFNRTEPCEVCDTYRTLKNDIPQRWEWTGPDKRNYDIHDFPFTDVDGSRLILEMGIDITERKQAEAELETYRLHLEDLVTERTAELANERTNLQRIFDVVHVGMMLVGEDGSVKRTNDVIRRWTGKRSTKVFNLQPGDALGCINALKDQAGCGNSSFCDTCQIRQTFQAVIQSGKPIHGVEVKSSLWLRGKKKDMWLDISADPLEVDGQPHAILALNDVTARKEAEQALQQAHDQLEQRVEQRTLELSAANKKLLSEIVERRKAEQELQNNVEELQIIQEELHFTNDSLMAAQAKVESERQKYQNLFDFAPIIYVTTDTAGVISEANKAARGLLTGLKPTLEGAKLLEFVSEADRSAFSNWLYQLQNLDGISGWETSLRLPTGLTRQVSINASRVIDPNDKTIDLHWLIADISERKQAEAQLHLQTSAMEAAANGIMITDRDGNIEWCNPAFAEVSGYDPKEVIGMNPRLLKSGKQNRAFYKKLWQTLLAGEVWHGEMINRRKNGELYVEEEIITPVRDESNEISHFIAIKQDITSRKQAEDALKAAYAYNRSLLEASVDPLVTITPEGKIGDVNSATEKVTGLSRQELIGTDFHSYFSDPFKARLGYQMAFESGSVHDYELEIRHKDGHTTPVLYNTSVYLAENGKPQGVFAVARDITDRKQFEAQLMQAEKHAVIGRMVGSVTHEINNPLQTIKNCLYLIQQDIPAESVIAEPLEMATSETARLADLVGQLRELYRPRTDVQDRPHELLDIVEEVHSLLTPHLNNSKVQWKPLTGLTRCYINCVRDQILEVFLNISMNAIEAMQTNGGKLSVDMAFKGEQVGVIFRDTGPGISPGMLAHIFEPFMTTKNNGLGLGLSISYGIVQRHGGQIVVENCPDGGASFTVWLPIGKKSKKEKNTNATKR